MAGLGMLEPLAPTSRAATILGDGGPSALEVAYKRKGIEADIGKTLAEAEKNKAAAKAADDKNKIEQQKMLEWLPETAALEHGNYFANVFNESNDRISEILARNGGIIPVAGEDGAEYRRIVQNIKQVKSDSDQLNKAMVGQLAMVQADKGKYLPGTAEKIIETYSDPKWLQTRTLPPDLLADHFDVNGYLEPLFSKIKADQTAYGNLTAEGGTEEGTRKFTLRDDIKQVAEMGASDPRAMPALKRQFDNMAPETQAKILQIAKDNKITPEAATALELGIGLVEYEEKTRNVTAPSSAGAGLARDRAAAVWFAEYLKGTQNGTYETEPVGEQNQRIGEFLETDKQPENAPGWWNNKSMPSNLRRDKTLNGLLWDKKEFYDATADKNIKVERDVKEVLIDPTSKKYLVKVAPAGEEWSKEKGEVIVVPFDQAESKMGKNLLGFNKEVIEAQGMYDVSAEKEGYGSRKGTGAQNIVTTPKSGPFVPGKQSSGPYIPGR